MSSRVAGMAIVVLGLGCTGPSPAAVSVSDGRYVMGTILEITLVAPSEAEGRAVLERLFGAAKALDRQFSRHISDSALRELNRTGGGGPHRVPPQLSRILRDSKAYTLATGGSFDVTVGPFVELWTSASRNGAAPIASELASVRERVGSEKLRIEDDGAVTFLAAGMSIDLGGVAKGYALDRLAELLDEASIDDAFLSFGQSSLLARGAPAGGGHWRALLRGAGDDYAGVVQLDDRALSISSSLGQWSEIGGVRYGHVVDPRSGAALTALALAAVVAPSAAEAEAWSKALLVLGGEGIERLSAHEGREGILLPEQGGRLMTGGFEQAVGFAPLAPIPSDAGTRTSDPASGGR